ncbi:hypothetical protein [Thalassotalea litorea]|uniref:hypothetical protein n=1 Tax=Thalassotalea litorea TaxID=2020715 RepID=UPI003734FD77
MNSVTSKNAVYKLYDSYVEATYFEGSDPGIDEAVFIYQFLSKHYKSNFGWISNRINSYSSHQIFVKALLEDFSNFKCVAWVTYHDDLKKRISPMPGFVPGRVMSKQFDNLDQAINWVQQVLEDLNNER